VVAGWVGAEGATESVQSWRLYATEDEREWGGGK
jgi:hypothetical protein